MMLHSIEDTLFATVVTSVPVTSGTQPKALFAAILTASTATSPR